MSLRTRLFEDMANTPLCRETTEEEITEEDYDSVFTPFGKGDNAENGLSIEIPVRKVLRTGTACDVKRSLFTGKRHADSDVSGDVTQDAHDATNKCNRCPGPPKRRRFSVESPSIVKDSTETCGIIQAVEKLEISADAIADGSRDYNLPLIQGKHNDLKSISCDVMADVINGRYNDRIGEVTVIDCRYPYEFHGGHIRGAANMYTLDMVYELLKQPVTSQQSHVIIFHCEFSSERGPKMYRFLRGQDRELNKDQYPRLNFPEVYLLEGGYKEFYAKHKNLCDPISYKPMLHEDHTSDLRHFRIKSKSWTAAEKPNVGNRRHRSRLNRHLSF